ALNTTPVLPEASKVSSILPDLAELQVELLFGWFEVKGYPLQGCRWLLFKVASSHFLPRDSTGAERSGQKGRQAGNEAQ
ncbi:MAG TPA: hypothetical protein V6D07_12105, partial [Trichocoleus sp.]